MVKLVDCGKIQGREAGAEPDDKSGYRKLISSSEYLVFVYFGYEHRYSHLITLKVDLDVAFWAN